MRHLVIWGIIFTSTVVPLLAQQPQGKTSPEKETEVGPAVAPVPSATEPVTPPPVTAAPQTEPAKSEKAVRYAQMNVAEISGTIGFSSATYSTSSYTSNAYNQFSFSPSISYFIIDRFSMGVVGSVNITGNSSTAFAAYLMPGFALDLNSIFFPYLNALFGYADITYSFISSGQSGIGYGGRTGIKIAVTQHVLLDFGVQYLVQNYAYSGTYAAAIGSSNTAVRTLSTTIGFSFYF